MIFLLFLVSVATIEVILRVDDSKRRKLKPPSASVSRYDVVSNPTSQSVLALMNTLDQHGRGQAPALECESKPMQADQASLAIIRKDV
jgi:hypothetical protein